MISAAVEPHASSFNPNNREPLQMERGTAGKAPGAERQNNPNKRKVLFVTSEFADLVKTGGLGDVSAALPRAMAHLHDVRVLIPGYPQVVDSDYPIHIVGELGGHAALPPCKIGRMDLPDGLVIYVLICPELYEREGSPYGANNGRDWPDNHIRFARLGLA
ncbi:MAG: starch synthase, partial [Pseudomonas sp.]